MSLRLLGLSTIIFIFSLSISLAQKPRPTTCPSVDVIKRVGLQNVLLSADGKWAASSQNNYGTNVIWTFVLSGNGEKTAYESIAREKANYELQSLTFQSGPFASGKNGVGCVYQTTKVKDVLLISPPINPLTLRIYLK